MRGFGSILEDYLEYYKISQSEFADRLGISQKHMNEIINGKTKISPELMVVISLLTDIDVNIIFHAEKTRDVYNELMEKYKSEEVAKKELMSYHLNDIVNHNWLKLSVAGSLVYDYIDLMDYFGISNINNTNNYLEKRYLFKALGNLSDDDKLKIFLWVRHCEIITKGIELVDYDSSKLNDLIDELKVERNRKFDKERLIKLFNKYGIILCIEKTLKNTKVEGCVRVMVSTPAIFMSTNMKDKASFYYTLYHEILHVKTNYNKLKSKTIVESDRNEGEIDYKALNLMVDDKIYNEILECYDNRESIALENDIPLCFLYYRLMIDKKISNRSKDYLRNREVIGEFK